MNGPEAALAACRFAHDASTMLLWGAFAYLVALVPRDLAQAVGRRLDTFHRAAIAVATLTTVAKLPIECATIGDGWGDALDAATMRAVLFETSVGWAWHVEALAAVLLLGTLAVPLRRRTGATVLASGLLLSTLALTGHAAMHEGWLGIAHRSNDTLHLLSAGAWVGALLPLRPILQALDEPTLRRSAGLALRRFSNAGHGAVTLVVATGTVNAGLVLGRWPTDWTSPYRAMLAGKIALVFAMIALALANRYVLVPRMGGGDIHTAAILRRSTTVVVTLGVTAITLVSIFGLLEPA